MLAEALGPNALELSFPQRETPIGRVIDAYLRSEQSMDDRAIHLLFSANRWETAERIRAELAKGTTIVCDRYACSGVAFSMAKSQSDMNMEWCRACDRGLPAPDCVIYLEMDPERAAARDGFGEERYETHEMQHAVRDAFRQVRLFRIRFFHPPPVHIRQTPHKTAHGSGSCAVEHRRRVLVC